MPRSKSKNGDGTIEVRTLSDGRTVYDVRWSYRDADGRPRRGTKRGFRTRREADTYRRRVTAQVDHGEFTAPSKLTLAEYLEGWLTGLRLRPQTIAGYQRDVRRHVVPHIGHVKLADLSPTHLDRLYQTLETQGSPSGEGPLSLSSVRGVHATLCSALTSAVRTGLRKDSPAPRATPPTMKQIKATRTGMATWTGPQVAAFLDATAQDRLGPLWHLMFATGMRRGEALALHWVDVDLDAKTVVIRASLGEDRRKGADGRRNGLVFGPTKSGRGHTVHLDDRTVSRLRSHRVQQHRERLRLGARWVDQDLVFCRGEAWLQPHEKAGGPLRPDRVSDAFRRRLDGVPANPPIRLHDARHTWATLALQAGIAPKVVQERLGHSSITVTMDVYSHVMPSMDADAASLVADTFIAPSGPHSAG